ncbi:MAG: hypothetical protein GHHEDOFH_00853 [Pseudorhodoplanes sp.]|nr:hypothetical protein [Pseudorhodoplanes sp.]
MTKIELAKSKDGREIVLRLKGIGQFPDRPSLRISWIGTNKTLGPKGWENAPVAIRPNHSREGKDLLLILDTSLTNYIAPGIPVEISIPDLNVSDQLNWPFHIPGAAGRSPGETVVEGGKDGVTGDQSETSESNDDIGQLHEQLAKKDAEIEKLRTLLKRDKRTIFGLPLSGFVTLTLLIALAVGAAGQYGFDVWFRELDNNPESIARLRETVRQLQRDNARLQTEAFAPLNEVAALTPTSPKGDSPEPKLPTRAREFYNKGVTNMKSGNRPEAVYWYKQAVGLCEREAMTYVGDAYFNGDGAPRDSRTGFQLMRCASALGSEQARDYLAELLRSGRIQLAPPAFGDAYKRAGR